MAGYLNKSGGMRAGEAVTGRGDLVADVGAGRQKLDSVKDDDLPDALRAMKPAERQVVIDKNAAERKTLNERMAELVKKRDRYVERAAQQRAEASPRIRSTARWPKRWRSRSSASLPRPGRWPKLPPVVKAGGSFHGDRLGG